MQLVENVDVNSNYFHEMANIEYANTQKLGVQDTMKRYSACQNKLNSAYMEYNSMIDHGKNLKLRIKEESYRLVILSGLINGKQEKNKVKEQVKRMKDQKKIEQVQIGQQLSQLRIEEMQGKSQASMFGNGGTQALLGGGGAVGMLMSGGGGGPIGMLGGGGRGGGFGAFGGGNQALLLGGSNIVFNPNQAPAMPSTTLALPSAPQNQVVSKTHTSSVHECVICTQCLFSYFCLCSCHF